MGFEQTRLRYAEVKSRSETVELHNTNPSGAVCGICSGAMLLQSEDDGKSTQPCGNDLFLKGQLLRRGEVRQGNDSIEEEKRQKK